MKPDDFESMCETLYELTSKQREGLLDLLQSRIWLYESEDGYKSDTGSKFGRIYEFDDSSIKIILRKTPMELLSYALKGETEDFRRRLFKIMTKANTAKLRKKMKSLGPVRMSEVNQAQGKILDAINLLASAGRIELPSPAVPYVVETNATAGNAANNDARLKKARVLLTLADGSLRNIIREIKAAQLVDFLWYINYERLTRKVHALSTQRFANELKDDFNDRWQGVNSDSATKMQLKMGRQAMQQVLKTLSRLAGEGQISIPSR